MTEVQTVMLLIAVSNISLFLILWYIINVEKHIKRTKINGNVFHDYNQDQFIKINRAFYNSRKRDEKILRVVRGNNKDTVAKIASVYNAVICSHNDIEKVAKQCRSIEGVARMCGNNDTEFNSKLTVIIKGVKESSRVLGLFEAMTEKAKCGRI